MQLSLIFSGSRCEASWFAAGNACFRVFAGNIRKTWYGARDYCLRQRAELAVVDSEVRRKIIGSRLTAIDTEHPDATIHRAFIGISKHAMWWWIGGKNILSSSWIPGYPKPRGGCAALAKASPDWKLFSGQCAEDRGFICQTMERKYFLIV